MATGFEFSVQLRGDTGKAHARRMRRDGFVPGIIYGAGSEPQLITLPHDAILHALAQESFHSHILTVKFDNGKTDTVVLKDVQRHVYKPKVMHVDFLRVSATSKLTMHVPLHFVGEAACAAIADGAVLSKLMNDVEIKCLPAHLPEFIEVDVSGLTLGHPLHLSDIQLPRGVELAHEIDEETDHPVVSVHLPRAAVAADEEEVVAEPVAEEEAPAAEGGARDNAE